MKTFPVSFLVAGSVIGSVARLDAPLSLWGGFDIETGTIIDVTHPNVGRSLAGKIVMMMEARGSSSSSSTLLEAARNGTAPAALVLARPDPILTIGSLVAWDLYQTAIPIVLLDISHWHAFDDGVAVEIVEGARAIRLTRDNWLNVRAEQTKLPSTGACRIGPDQS
jgi:hypothetical protein